MPRTKKVSNETKPVAVKDEKPTVAADVAANADKSDFKVVKIGSLQLERSHIDDPEKLRFYLDKDSFLSLSAKALSLRLTWDEYLRRIVWNDLQLAK